ncbi:uncharacterized protein LOC118265726 [Spodoptera frugiperda]|uniref:Uncharacterized protein LOC118265726 n=1 Tax=Spodoptera frugiperda TaxID=7108 RepID=A0A9R0CZE6_SPOFR|nr:uncharacterized protein LOC118265726 [Spodoptera frugiperda]
MDSRDDKKSLKTRQNQYAFNRYYESNAGHLFVSHINPFDTVGDRGREVKENLIKKRNTQELIAIFENRSENYDLDNKIEVKKINATPSTEIVDEIMKTGPFTKNIFMSDRYCETDSLFIEHQRPIAQPATSISATVLDDDYGVCSRNVFKSPSSDYEDRFEEYNVDNNRCIRDSNELVTQVLGEEKKQCEKTTYCRPLLNMYNQEFIYKTMQRNVRLQKLVKKLVVARQREKERESWNNYINDLKNKHRYYSNEPTRISPQYVPGDRHTPEMIDDFYNTRFQWRQSNPCQHLLDDFYNTRGYAPPRAWCPRPPEYDNGMLPDVESFIYDNNRFCYPTCSQANMKKWNTERLHSHYGYDWYTRPSGRFFRGNTIVIEKDDGGMFDRLEGTTRPHAAPRTRNRKSKRNHSVIPEQKHTDAMPFVDETELTNVTATASPVAVDDRNIYYPYSREPIHAGAIGDKKDSFSRVSIEEPSELSQDTKSKQQPLKNKVDLNVPNKETTIQNQQIEVSNVSQPQVSYMNDTKVKDELPDNVETNKLANNVAQKVNSKHKKINYEKTETEENKQENLKDTFKKVTENISKLKNKLRQSEQDVRIKSLSTIEVKVDGLMKSINSIMEDIKKKETLLKRNASVATSFVTTHQKLNRQKSDPYSTVKNENFLCSVMHSSSRSVTISDLDANDYRRQREDNIAKIDKILMEEMNKSNKVKRDIEELLNLRLDRSCSVQITFDIPTKEISTEVTNSLSKAKLGSRAEIVVEEIQTQCSSDRRQMTIAVNTDPLGLLDLFKISTDTIKRLFSFVPYLSYNSYFSLLQLSPKRCASHYICNICGAVFSRPSQLSNHIEQHTLGKTRDCCVCRHALDMQRTQAGLFECRYCGQRFTRAYCRELHEQTCARHLGRTHDVNSGHILLR